MLYSFFDEYDLSEKTVIPFSTHNGSRLSGTVDTIAELEPGASVIEDGFTVNERDAEDFILCGFWDGIWRICSDVRKQPEKPELNSRNRKDRFLLILFDNAEKKAVWCLEANMVRVVVKPYEIKTLEVEF